MEGRFPYDKIAVLNIFPAIHIIPTVDTINNKNVKIISHAGGVCMAMRMTINGGVKGGIYDKILMNCECGFCITTIIKPIGTTSSILT